MRLPQLTAVTATLVGAGLAAAVAVPASASAAPASHYAQARADWVKGAHAATAELDTYWAAAHSQLGHYGMRYSVELKQLASLEQLPLTDTTKAERAAATDITRSLNGFFRTPGLYGVKPAATPYQAAKADWLRSFDVAAAEQNRYLAAAHKQLARAGMRYMGAMKALSALQQLPLTDLTPDEQKAAAQIVHDLNAFFHTHEG